jgi:1-acyl-sn-glycerol-3-phosphate acyltransferase
LSSPPTGCARLRADRADHGTLTAAILDFLAGQDLLTLEQIRLALDREIDEAGPDAVIALKQRLLADAGWSYYPRDPLAQRIHHVLADTLLDPDSELQGIEHVSAIAGRPVVIIANHLSYADANLLEILLQRSGGAALANRMTAIAGPKVFTNRQRRFSSLCFGTIKVPQSADVASEEAVLTAREVARAARQSIDTAHERLCAGDALLVFAEGTRSRTRHMQQLLPAVARYLDAPATWILPTGIAGTEALFGIGEASIAAARVSMRIGAPLDAAMLRTAADGDRRLMMDAVGLAIAAILPPAYRGFYAKPPAFAEAQRVLERSLAASI